MKGLNQFREFNYARFAAEKDLTVTAIGPWKDFDTKAILGTSVTVVITRDDTQYKASKDGAQISNLYSSFKIKVPVPASAIAVKIGDVVSATDPVATVYGQYSNELSVKASNVVKKIATQTAGGK